MPTLHWIGKEKVVKHHHEVPFKTLEQEYVYTAPEGTPQNSTGNKIIHGDNLEALKALLPEFEGRIKCIYIDPPYNTGNESWAYNDNVNDPRIQKWLNQVVGKEGEDLSRHDKWLCMMYPRLKLLHRLLATDGSIFVSIDDNEVHHLRLVMDEIFGAQNFLCSFAWEKRYSPPPDTKDIGYLHETLLAYRKSAMFKRNLLPLTLDQTGRYKNPDHDPRGPWQSMDYTCRYTAEERPNLYYPIQNPNTGEEIWPKKTRVWSMSQEVHDENAREDRNWWGKDGKSSTPRLKNFLSEIQQGMIPVSLLKHEIVGHTDEAAKELRGVLPEIKFTPKPTRLIQHLLNIASDRNSIILDSFAGSGTTAHAVLKLNAEDGGNRRFILTEMMDYAETITAERVRRVMNGYGEGNKGVAGLGGSFEFYTIGERLFDEDGNLNEAVPVEKIRRYVAYTEGVGYSLSEMSPYYIGHANGAAYLFYYEPDHATALDYEFLSSLQFSGGVRPETLVIYADNCLLAQDQLRKHSIIFKKIPRDITRF